MDAVITTLVDALAGMLKAISQIDLTKFNSDAIADYANIIGPIMKAGINFFMGFIQ